MKTNNEYLKHISEVWAVKEKIYRETEAMDFKQYIKYLDQNLEDLRKRFKNKYAIKNAA